MTKFASQALKMINRILQKLKSYSKIREEERLFRNLSADEIKLITTLKNKNLTYLSKKKLVSIVNSIKEINQTSLKGLYVEAGCALGGSSILISKLKNLTASLNVYDVFGMIPAPSAADTADVHERYQTIVEGKSSGLGDELYYGYEENLYDKVIANLRSFQIDLEKENVHLIKGLVQDTMHISEPVVFAHIDVDWYEPVKTCLEQIWPSLVIGGAIILDDYHDWGGCRKATDEYFKAFEGQFIMDDSLESLKITRVK